MFWKPFGDPALLDDEDDRHGEFQLLQLNVMNTEPCTSVTKCSQQKHELNKKEREKLIQVIVVTHVGEMYLIRLIQIK